MQNDVEESIKVMLTNPCMCKPYINIIGAIIIII